MHQWARTDSRISHSPNQLPYRWMRPCVVLCNSNNPKNCGHTGDPLNNGELHYRKEGSSSQSATTIPSRFDVYLSAENTYASPRYGYLKSLALAVSFKLTICMMQCRFYLTLRNGPEVINEVVVSASEQPSKRTLANQQEAHGIVGWRDRRYNTALTGAGY